MDCPEKKLRYSWSKAYMVVPRDHIKSHKYINAKPFIPSYENQECVNLNWLLGYEYHRIWKREVCEFLKIRAKGEIKPKAKRPTFPKKPKKDETKKDFKMKKFENIPCRTDHKRSGKV